MSRTSEFTIELSEIHALQESLSIHLEQAETTLNRLLLKREQMIRAINRQQWDYVQYRLDDLQQELSDVTEKLDTLAIIPESLQDFLAV